MIRCVIHAPWFGPLPFYTAAFLASCAASPNILWVVHSDGYRPWYAPTNVLWIQVANLQARIDKVFPGAPARLWRHKLCDLKPFWPQIFGELGLRSEYVGWVDWDVVHNLDALEFNFTAAKFTPGWMASPLFICRRDSWLEVYPHDVRRMLGMEAVTGWDEDYYLPLVDADILQPGLTPGIDLVGRAKYALHLFHDKHHPQGFARTVARFCDFST